MANIAVRPLFIIFELWYLGDIQEDLKKANVTPVYKDFREDPENYRPICITSFPGKPMEKIFLGAVTSQMEPMIRKSQDRLTKEKFCLTNLIASYNK